MTKDSSTTEDCGIVGDLLRLSPGRDDGDLPSAIADGSRRQRYQSPGRDDSEWRAIYFRP